MIHTVKGFGIVNKAEVDAFLELFCFFHDPADVGNLISGSSAFSKTSLNIRKFTGHILLKPGLENFKHYCNSIPGHISGEDMIQKDTCAPVFIIVLFTIAKTWKKPKCPLTEEWIKKMWFVYIYTYIYIHTYIYIYIHTHTHIHTYIHTMEYYITIKMN